MKRLALLTVASLMVVWSQAGAVEPYAGSVKLEAGTGNDLILTVEANRADCLLAVGQPDRYLSEFIKATRDSVMGQALTNRSLKVMTVERAEPGACVDGLQKVRLTLAPKS